jgi:hypothetical protein
MRYSWLAWEFPSPQSVTHAVRVREVCTSIDDLPPVGLSSGGGVVFSSCCNGGGVGVMAMVGGGGGGVAVRTAPLGGSVSDHTSDLVSGDLQ